jgi:hypothetical protein
MGAIVGLQAAWMLARGRPEGAVLLETPPKAAMATAARSFWAAPLCLPALLCLHLIEWLQAGTGVYPASAVVLDLAGFAVGWLGFAVITHGLARRLGRQAHWPRFITAWNWCNVLQYLMLVLAALPSLLGLPDIVTETAWLVAMGWALWLEWFATRLTLEVPSLTAAALVAVDVSIGLLLVGFTS